MFNQPQYYVSLNYNQLGIKLKNEIKLKKKQKKIIHVYKRYCYNVFPTCVLCIVSKRFDSVDKHIVEEQ